MARTAIVLFNLGGPDSPEAVRPFLFNLFNDPAIIRLPWILRRPLASLISGRRAKTAQAIYARMGGRSPILPETEKQAAALEKALNSPGQNNLEIRVFIAMRYWHPFAAETAKAVQAWGAEKVVMLPLYPQYSTTTTQSSFDDWNRAAKAAGLSVPHVHVTQYPIQPGFIAANVALIREALARVEKPYRLLFSAHGLPKKIVAAGDPYQRQVEQSAAAVVAGLNIPDLDWQICYQSRVGPLEWIGPATEAEIKRAGADGKAILLCPIAFVSEHSETLVELDIEYAELAHEHGVKSYVRVPTVGVQPDFIDGLAQLVRSAL